MHIEKLDGIDTNVFDTHSVLASSLPPAESDLKKFLSYNPIHHLALYQEKGIEADRSFLYNPDRELIETDRAGWRFYDRVYSQYFKQLRYEQINLLEIGIEYGYGLLAWSRYFPNANIQGMELYSSFESEYKTIRQNFPKHSTSIEFNVNADSRVAATWSSLFVNKLFDIIIDDGGHSPRTQMSTIQNGIHYLKDQAMYFIEDIKLESSSPAAKHQMYAFYQNLAAQHGFKLKLYKHVSPYRVRLLEMSKSERLFHIMQKMQREGLERGNLADLAKQSLKIDNGDPHNYMLAFTRGFQ